ncbi:MAG TPA: alpha/beta fold hydrolase [Anaerolineales bacterium]|nr:alpha/beta fold hydrolase [Anaerolineales bacterium]
MKPIHLTLVVLLAFIFSACTPAAPTAVPTEVVDTPAAAATEVTATTEAFRALNRIEIPAPSLAENLVGEPAERTIYVYLPPSYATSEKRYPVVYYLPGYGDSGIIGFRLPDDMNSLIESGQLKEMMIVIASGDSKTGGSFYVNSPVTGNWEDHLVFDVVGYVDSNFRTLAQAESRGITGHSMGGFGALNIAMRHPDVFSAVYSMSPGLFDENGLAESFLFAQERTITNFVNYEKELAALPLEEAQEKMFLSPQEFSLAYGYAFAPNPDRHPPYFDYPYTEVDGKLVRDDEIWNKWESGFGGIAGETLQYKENLLKLKGIVVDYGIYDENPWIPKGVEYYGEQLTAAGISVKVAGYNGNHSNQLGQRIREFMLPFFSTTLEFE